VAEGLKGLPPTVPAPRGAATGRGRVSLPPTALRMRATSLPRPSGCACSRGGRGCDRGATARHETPAAGPARTSLRTGTPVLDHDEGGGALFAPRGTPHSRPHSDSWALAGRVADRGGTKPREGLACQRVPVGAWPRQPLTDQLHAHVLDRKALDESNSVKMCASSRYSTRHFASLTITIETVTPSFHGHPWGTRRSPPALRGPRSSKGAQPR
jgi:hypothetical protein